MVSFDNTVFRNNTACRKLTTIPILESRRVHGSPPLISNGNWPHLVISIVPFLLLLGEILYPWPNLHNCAVMTTYRYVDNTHLFSLTVRESKCLRNEKCFGLTDVTGSSFYLIQEDHVL